MGEAIERHLYQEAAWARVPVAAATAREPEETYEPSRKPRLLDQVREAIRTRHYSHRTEEACVGWIKRFILFHGKRHPAEMGKPEVEQFLTALALRRHVAASTQNQALAGILFLYKDVLGKDPGWLEDVVRVGSSRREDDDDLHACLEPWRAGRPEPRRPILLARQQAPC